MTKKEAIEHFERVKRQHGIEISMHELRYKIRNYFSTLKKPKHFEKLLQDYTNNIYKLKQWNNRSQNKQ